MNIFGALLSAIGGACRAFVAVFSAKNSKDMQSNKEAQQVEDIRAEVRRQPDGFDQDVAP